LAIAVPSGGENSQACLIAGSPDRLYRSKTLDYTESGTISKPTNKVEKWEIVTETPLAS
jgi:hypothetical protein